ncbi:hypothetical protein DVH24_040011 [Malus domestica]|uniref:Uncharacterized protein n=1 Tax=Malus domestica TaxID=3750 RepID=A0A498I493_MALDO|nr:hypothetical protein DVH24_040011 [Malus domestica]
MPLDEGDLECDGAELEDDAPGVESGLTVGGDSDVDRDGDHVDHGVGLEGLIFLGDAYGIDIDRHASLKHPEGGVGEP